MLKRKWMKLAVTAMLAGAMFCFGGCGGADKDAADAGTDVKAAAPTGTYIGQENDGVAEFKGIRYGEFKPFLPATDVTTTEAD